MHYTESMLRQIRLKGWCDHPAGFRCGVEGIPVCRVCRPADYADELQRGTVDYSPAWRNYSFHRVRIHGGTVVEGCNFTQRRPGTAAIEVLGSGIVTFRRCNLSSVLTTPRMVLEKCQTCQSWLVEEEDPDDPGNNRERRLVIASNPLDLTGLEVPPLNVKLDKPVADLADNEVCGLMAEAWFLRRPEQEALGAYEMGRRSTADRGRVTNDAYRMASRAHPPSAVKGGTRVVIRDRPASKRAFTDWSSVAMKPQAERV